MFSLGSIWNYVTLLLLLLLLLLLNQSHLFMIIIIHFMSSKAKQKKLFNCVKAKNKNKIKLTHRTTRNRYICVNQNKIKRRSKN